MKRFLIIAAAAGAILVSCAKTETVNVSDAKYIGFDNAYIGNPTKAITETDATSLGSFIVYGGYDGQQVFNNVTVEPNSNGEWTYSPLVPWVDDKTYKFFAYSKLEEGTPTYDYGTGLTFTDVTVNGTINQVDFVYDESGEIPSGAENTVRAKVQFTFEHMFSMVQFTIKSGLPEDVVLTITDIKFYGMDSQNDLTNGIWGSTPDTPIAEVSPITLTGGTAQATPTTPTNYVNNCVVMPQTIDENTVFAKFTVTAPAGTSLKEPVAKDITALIPADTWEPGYRYNYIVTIDGQTLNFITFDTPKVSPWTDENISMVNGTTTGQIVGQ